MIDCRSVARSCTDEYPVSSHSAGFTLMNDPSRPVSAIPIGASSKACVNCTSAWRRASSASMRAVMSRADA